jgi:hypothetical protein
VNAPLRLAAVRAVHTAIYIVMTAATAAVLYAAGTGERGPWLWGSLALVVAESVVFIGCGLKCPLTGLAVRYGARHGAIFDTFLPEAITRHTFTVFGPLIVLGLSALAVRWLVGG